ncbi:hypothetical protein [Komagataeibacter saccharivorans]|uniref:hypothetical protein n=1 Tax=Komagataeibacter saccharivorans TaxID=265959 RepID=UPI0010C58202|nr:hypothetical protein [Komagataeibacter saccharivorans]QBL95452.1 hypothetical protein KSAC_32730 [Komagataeibacter saccharivorans]
MDHQEDRTVGSRLPEWLDAGRAREVLAPDRQREAAANGHGDSSARAMPEPGA